MPVLALILSWCTFSQAPATIPTVFGSHWVQEHGNHATPSSSEAVTSTYHNRYPKLIGSNLTNVLGMHSIKSRVWFCIGWMKDEPTPSGIQMSLGVEKNAVMSLAVESLIYGTLWGTPADLWR
jgi:hypothetical protein